MRKIEIFDTTLRDGAQARGISFSVEDKLAITEVLDDMGIAFIEAGNPGSNPKDLEFFEKVSELDLKNSKLVAFGSTRRKGIKPEEDQNLQSLLKANTEYVTIFGKTWDFHVTDIIKTSLEENLEMIEDTVEYLISKGKEVIFDAEHFFDGYKNNPEYAVEALLAAAKGGSETLVLCDTNGGCFPEEIEKITRNVLNKVMLEYPRIKIGIHVHNDMSFAVINSIKAVEAGATHIQGTLIGFGERCGNANLSTIIANLQLKKGIKILEEEKIEQLTQFSRAVAEIANITIDDGMPYVGQNAFAHKGGMHIDGVTKASHSFEHISPTKVGNEREFLLSEVSGRTTILEEIQKVDSSINRDSKETKEIIERLKELEYKGYQFEGAKATFELVIRKYLGKHNNFFELIYFDVKGNYQGSEYHSVAIVKLKVGGEIKLTVAEGDGPVNALDTALRQALQGFYPQLNSMKLIDYKVRVLKGLESATASKVRVLIETTDGKNIWNTIGVSTDIIEASWIALVDSIEYLLIKSKV
ncbi:MAG: citramalate synthase [Leptotrichiaceae bacterium]